MLVMTKKKCIPCLLNVQITTAEKNIIMSKTKQFSKIMPLTPAVFYILLSLSTKKRHGYDIMKQVASDSNGKVSLGPGTLYGAIKRMLEEKLIAEVSSGFGHERRRY